MIDDFDDVFVNIHSLLEKYRHKYNNTYNYESSNDILNMIITDLEDLLLEE